MKRILVMKDGQKKTVKKDDGRYWVCENDIRLKKCNPDIVRIDEVKEESKKEEKKGE